MDLASAIILVTCCDKGSFTIACLSSARRFVVGTRVALPRHANHVIGLHNVPVQGMSDRPEAKLGANA